MGEATRAQLISVFTNDIVNETIDACIVVIKEGRDASCYIDDLEDLRNTLIKDRGGDD